MLSALLSNTVYIKVHPNRLEFRHIESGKSLVLTSAQAFTTRRLLVGQYRGAGARKVKVWVGHVLSDREEDEYAKYA